MARFMCLLTFLPSLPWGLPPPDSDGTAGFDVGFDDTNPQRPDAVLRQVFYVPGQWQINVKAHVVYQGADGTVSLDSAPFPLGNPGS